MIRVPSDYIVTKIYNLGTRNECVLLSILNEGELFSILLHGYFKEYLHQVNQVNSYLSSCRECSDLF